MSGPRSDALPRLLPRPQPDLAQQGLAAPAQQYSSTPTRPAVAACEACRKRRSKCSAERPTCSTCAKRGVPCRYDSRPEETPTQSLKRKYRETQQREELYQELFGLIRSMSDHDAFDVVRRIKLGHDVEHLLTHAKAGSLLLQLAVEPESRYRYEFPYNPSMPAELSRIGNPYLKSILYEATSVVVGATSQTQSASIPPANNNSAMTLAGADVERNDYKSIWYKPLHAAQVIDARLNAVKPSVWTSVSKDDSLMRELMGAYFLYEYSIYPVFHKDYFLDAMAQQQSDLCSSLLVNVVLAYGCYAHKGLSNHVQYWDPETLGYKFLAEARRLWDMEAREARITTAQAAALLNVIHNFCGLDKIGIIYGARSVSMAHELLLFERPLHGDGRMRCARTFTAWAIYNFETLCAFHFMRLPLVTAPPQTALPAIAENPDWYSEVWIRYPAGTRPVPIHFGAVFKANSELRVIMNDFCQIAFAADQSLSLDQATAFHDRFEIWFGSLPRSLQPANICLPGHFILHIEYLNNQISLHEPFASNKVEQTRLDTAKIHMQTIIRLWYLRHGFNMPNVFLLQPLALIALNCLQAMEQPGADLEDLRSTLFLVTKGLRDQAAHFYLSETIFRVVRSKMKARELQLMQTISDISDLQDEITQATIERVQASWTATIVTRVDDLEAHELGKQLTEASQQQSAA